MIENIKGKNKPSLMDISNIVSKYYYDKCSVKYIYMLLTIYSKYNKLYMSDIVDDLKILIPEC